MISDALLRVFISLIYTYAGEENDALPDDLFPRILVCSPPPPFVASPGTCLLRATPAQTDHTA